MYTILVHTFLERYSINPIMRIYIMRSAHPLGQVSLAYLGDGTLGVIDTTIITKESVFYGLYQSRQLWVVVDECLRAQ